MKNLAEEMFEVWEPEVELQGDLLNTEFTNSLNQLAREALGEVKSKGVRPRLIKPDQELSELTRRARELYKIWKEQRDEVSRREYRAVWYAKRKRVRQLIMEEEARAVHELEHLRCRDPKEFWKRLKKLSSTSGEKQKQLPTSIVNSNNQLVSGEDLMNAWADAFEKLGNSCKQNFDSDFEAKILQLLHQVEHRELGILDTQVDENETLDFNQPILLSEVSRAIKSLRKGKAVGVDGIFNEIFMYGGESLVSATWKFYQAVWSGEEFPKLWSKGIIFPIFKGGDLEAEKDPK